MKIRYGQIKAALAKVLNMTAADARVLDYCNRAVERLLYEGKFLDTTARYSVCVSGEHCLVWPRQFETIETCHVCSHPVTLRGPWYEALENGPGLASDCGPCLTLIDRGNTVTFDWVTTTGYKLAIYADGTESAGTVLLRYFDSTGNRVYTTFGGATIEGERLAIPTAGNYTVATFEMLPRGLYHVQKPVTNRVIRLYAQKISDGSLLPLGYYEPDETLPVYRHSYLTTLDGGSCDATQVTIIGKLRFIPAINDDSVMMISHTEAIRLGCQAVYAEECKLYDEARLLWYGRPNPVTGKMEGGAIPLLNTQLEHYRGSGQVDPIRMVGSETYGGGGVCNIV